MRLQRSQVTWSQLQVGIFALICGVILLWLILFAGNGLKAVQNRFAVQTVIDSASGLKSGDVVRLAGIEGWNGQGSRIRSPRWCGKSPNTAESKSTSRATSQERFNRSG